MMLFQSLLKHFLVISGDLRNLIIKRVNKLQMAKSIFFTSFTFLIIIRSWILMFTTSKDFQRFAGDMFYILGNNESKSFHFLFVVCAVFNIIYRIGTTRGELLGKLNSLTDLEPLIRDEDNYKELQLTEKNFRKFKKLLKNYVIWTLLGTVSVYGCELLMLGTIMTLAILNSITIAVQINIILTTIILLIYLYYVTGSCFAIAFYYAMSAVYLKYRFNDINERIGAMNESTEPMTSKQLLDVYKDSKRVIVKVKRYNEFIGKYIGFVICYVFNFLAGSGVFIIAYIEFESPFVKYAQSLFCFELLLVVFFFTSVGGQVFSAALATHNILKKLIVSRGPTMHPRVQMKLNEVLESLSSENLPVGYYCLDWFPLVPKTFIDVRY